jgi:hypothetical protein
MVIVSRMRKMFSIFLAAALFFLITFDSGSSMQVLAKPLTPEASAYNVDKPTTPELGQRREQEKARSNLKELAGESFSTEKDTGRPTKNKENKEGAFQRVTDNVREKLNLDEPVPQSTKDFLNDVRDSVTSKD